MTTESQNKVDIAVNIHYIRYNMRNKTTTYVTRCQRTWRIVWKQVEATKANSDKNNVPKKRLIYVSPQIMYVTYKSPTWSMKSTWSMYTTKSATYVSWGICR